MHATAAAVAGNSVNSSTTSTGAPSATQVDIPNTTPIEANDTPIISWLNTEVELVTESM
ncbi:unannotated protein [freshwater metagenome]|uniref:Unannotated protein n=1 Tax=freshwater metagenome TaxID=449393 RepID=A0A6J6YDF0_9ZZZZ